MERALVIGSTGFVGSHLVRALVHSDVQVEAMRRWNSDTRRIASLEVPTRVADLLDRDSLLETLAGYNYVFMAAAPPVDCEPGEYLGRSVRGIRNLLEVARELDVERVVLTSCATTVGPPAHGEASVEEDVYLPGSAEDHVVEAQYAVEQECYREAADGMDIAIVTPGICIGPEAAIPSRDLLSYVGERARINLVDVDDVARAHLKAARRESFGERYIL
ncbi:MAG: NAD-dependent epimerase/dehydratase family protein, partial [Persicimonas sp.]